MSRSCALDERTSAKHASAASVSASETRGGGGCDSGDAATRRAEAAAAAVDAGDAAGPAADAATAAADAAEKNSSPLAAAALSGAAAGTSAKSDCRRALRRRCSAASTSSMKSPPLLAEDGKRVRAEEAIGEPLGEEQRSIDGLDSFVKQKTPSTKIVPSTLFLHYIGCLADAADVQRCVCTFLRARFDERLRTRSESTPRRCDSVTPSRKLFQPAHPADSLRAARRIR